MAELRECPCCGKTDTVGLTDCHELQECKNFECCESYGYVCIVCDVNKGGCGASGGYAQTADEAAQKWNRRTAPEITGETSDGYHTFNELYHHRAVLFSVICNNYPELAWKSKKHSDGTMFDGDFIVGINTPKGPASYHYDIDLYWDMFRVPEIPNAPEWDGYTPTQAIDRIASLGAAPENKPLTLEELQQMDGEPVWTVGTGANRSKSYWCLVMRFRESVYTVVGDEMVEVGEFCQYGKTWLAYRRKPEEDVK